MSARIIISQRVVQAVAITVQALRVGRIWHQCIRANKPPYSSIVVPGIIEVEAGLVKALAGEKFVCIYSSGTISAGSV